MQAIDAGEWDCKVLISGAPDLVHLNAIEQCKNSNGPQLLQTGPKRLNSRNASANS